MLLSLFFTLVSRMSAATNKKRTAYSPSLIQGFRNRKRQICYYFGYKELQHKSRGFGQNTHPCGNSLIPWCHQNTKKARYLMQEMCGYLQYLVLLCDSGLFQWWQTEGKSKFAALATLARKYLAVLLPWWQARDS